MDIATAATYGAFEIEADEREEMERALREFEEWEDSGVKVEVLSAS